MFYKKNTNFAVENYDNKKIAGHYQHFVIVCAKIINFR